MPATKPEIVLVGPLKPVIVKGLDAACTVYKAAEAKDRDAFIAEHAHVRAIACSDTAYKIPGDLMARFPKLQIVASFGVGYDHMDAKWAAAHNVILTNTAGVLTEEVADTALGLLLCTVREFPQAERHLRAQKLQRCQIFERRNIGCPLQLALPPPRVSICPHQTSEQAELIDA